MTTIQIDVSDELIGRIGREAVKERLEKILAFEELKRLADGIQQQLADSGTDSDALFEAARQAAWNQHKKQFPPAP